MRAMQRVAAVIGVLALGITDSAGAGGLRLSSEAFTHGSAIPARYTCDGSDISPPLAWRGIPKGAHSLALIVSDPDAPDPNAPRLTWYHWVLYAIPAKLSGLPEDVDPQHISAAIRTGLNGWGHADYGGPCPPVGRHRYFFRLYALDQRLDLREQPSATALRKAMQGHIIAETALMGTYARTRE
ncbi:MAG: YbhB/YbcL family Raf kinase inhibitor-like protein [Nitrococcus sp.]|nr:YbhB/YbcL family Raf kinase inhibitor-like protein [Nitrococcus sp.]